MIPDVLGNLTSIIELDRSNNRFEGRILTSFKRLCNLKSIVFSNIKLSQDMSEVLDILSECASNQIERLDLSYTKLFGHLTNHLARFKSIKYLDVSGNSISGIIPPCLGQLSWLRTLRLFNNKLNGSLGEIHFANLTSLVALSAFGNSLKLEVNKDWTPSFHQLEVLDLGSSSLGPHFPSWFFSLKFLRYLDVFNTGIVGTIPSKFWKFLFQSFVFNLSHNQIHGHIPNLPERLVDLRHLI
ncbi:hypothetical protein ACOSP7_030455 [Xanthoceras sorbifolium]